MSMSNVKRNQHDKGTQYMSSEAARLKDDVSCEASKLKDEAKEGVKEMGNLASEGLEMLRESTNECLEQGRAKAQELAAVLEAQIRAQPLTAVLVAGGVGLLLGVMWSRR